MSSDVGWHIRDKLWPMPKHGLVLLNRALGRKAQDGHLDFHTAPEQAVQIYDKTVKAT